MKYLRKLLCRAVGHQYRATHEFSPETRRVGCARCGGDWAMNDRLRILVAWGPEFDAFYFSESSPVGADKE